MQSFVKTIWSNINYRIAAIILGIMLLWLLSGIFGGGDHTAETSSSGESSQTTKELAQVRARTISSALYPLHVIVKGRTEADRIVDLKAEVGGQVVELVAEKGEFVKAGQTICRLAMEDRQLRLEEADAAVQQAKIDYEGALRLKTGGFQSETAIANAKARLEAAKANQLRRKIDVQKTAIKAPFDGVVDEQTVEVGTLMRAGDTCATILDLDPLVVSGQVSESDVIRIPESADVKVKLGGQVLDGKVRYVARNADTATRTFRVEAMIPNRSMDLFSGITTEMEIITRDVPAHLVTASLLLLDDDGRLALRLLNANDEVEIYTVKIIGDDDQGVWVTGLPDEATLITVGQEYVTLGEKVAVTYEGSADKRAEKVAAMQPDSESETPSTASEEAVDSDAVNETDAEDEGDAASNTASNTNAETVSADL